MTMESVLNLDRGVVRLLLVVKTNISNFRHLCFPACGTGIALYICEGEVVDFNKDRNILYIGLALILVGFVSLVHHMFSRSEAGRDGQTVSWEYEGTQVKLDKKAYDTSHGDSRQVMFEKRMVRRNKFIGQKNAPSPESKDSKKVAAKKADKKAKKDEDKKKEEEEKKEGEKETTEEVAEETPDEQPDKEPEPKAVANTTGPTFVVGGKRSPTDNPDPDVNEWVGRFLKNPAKKTLVEFVQAHELGEMSDQVYYQVIDELIFSENPRAALLAVNALELTRSVRSFERIVQLINGDAPTTAIAEASRKAVERFAQLGGIPVLREVIASTTDVNSILEATRLVRMILEKSLELVQKENNGRIQTQSTQQSGARSLYELLPVLEQTRSESSDSVVNASLSQTIQALQQAQSQFPFEVGIISDIPNPDNSGQIL